MLGNGDDTFGAPVANPVSLPGVVIQDMVEGDFNKDGKGDLAAVVFVSANSTSQVYVFTSNGDGTFQPHLVDTLPTAAPSLAAADFNHDGNLDLVVIDEVGNPSVLIYLAKGDGTFSAGATYMTGTSFTNTVQAADFNGDGKVDITVGTESGLDFFAGNGDGTFQPFVKTATLTSITGSFLAEKWTLRLRFSPVSGFCDSEKSFGCMRSGVPQIHFRSCGVHFDLGLCRFESPDSAYGLSCRQRPRR